jgi:hypothetical protein
MVAVVADDPFRQNVRLVSDGLREDVFDCIEAAIAFAADKAAAPGGPGEKTLIGPMLTRPLELACLPPFAQLSRPLPHAQ